MEELTSRSVAVFKRSFKISGFDETFLAGEYETEAKLTSPPDQRDPAAWKASVMVELHPRISHAGLARNLTASLADLDQARARDKLTGKALSEVFLEEILADPMVRLVMEADGVSAAHLRHLYSGSDTPDPKVSVSASRSPNQGQRDEDPVRAAENEGMPSRPETPSRLRIRDVAGQV